MPRRYARRACTTLLGSLWHDVHDAYRALRSSHGYAIWVVGSLAVGIAVTIAALATLNASMILPFPAITRQEQLVRVAMSRNCGRPDCWTRMSSTADFAALSEGLTGLQGLAAYTQGTIAIALPEARSMGSLLTSANYFDVLGVRPALGRGFNATDAETHAAVAVIAFSLWTREFGADPSVIGRSIRAADQFVEIVGVAPAFFMGIDRVRPGSRDPGVWLPMWLADRVLPLTAAEHRRQERDVRFVGRLRDGADASQVQAEARVLGSLGSTRWHLEALRRCSSQPCFSPAQFLPFEPREWIRWRASRMRERRSPREPGSGFRAAGAQRARASAGVIPERTYLV